MDTAPLRPLAGEVGPFASVHFDDSHDTEDAAKLRQLRLKEIEAALDDQRGDRETIEAILEVVRESEPPVGKAGCSVIAAHGVVLVHRRLAAPPPLQDVRFSALPYLLPLVAQADDDPPYLLVLADRRGADVTAFVEGESRTETVQGRDHPVHKVRGGGSAHRDLQAHTEETVHHNLEDVAAHVEKACLHSGARLVILAGEVQARAALAELFPPPVRGITVEIEAGSRAPGSSADELDRRVHEVLAGRRLAALDDLAGRFRAEAGRNSGLAVSGLDAVSEALTDANVATLLIGEPGDATVFAGPEPVQIAATRTPLDAQGIADPAVRRADEAIPFAAIATGAEIVMTDERLELPGGFGALLRHT